LKKSGQTQGTAPTENSRGESCVHPNIDLDIVSNPEFLKE
jgi:UDP-glucose 6-dehydrogenase